MELSHSEEEEKQFADNEMKYQISEECYMIDINWWNKWKAFAAKKDKKVFPPGPIFNVPLVNLSIEYEEELGRAADISKPLNDWKKMSLKPHLVEGKDYIFVGEKVWKYLQSLYKGWPEIRLQVVGDAYQPGFEKGSPDLSPFHLTILEEVDAKKPALSSGILVSKKASMTLLKKIIADKLDMKISGISCKYFDPVTKNTKFVKAGSSSIEENNIHNNSEIIVNSLIDGGSSRSSNALPAASGQQKNDKRFFWEENDEELNKALRLSKLEFDRDNGKSSVPKEEKKGLTELDQEYIASLFEPDYLPMSHIPAGFPGIQDDSAINSGKKGPPRVFTRDVKGSIEKFYAKIEKVKTNPEELNRDFEKYYSQAEAALSGKRLVLTSKKLKNIGESLDKLATPDTEKLKISPTL